MKPRKPLRRVSKARAKQQAEYAKAKRVFLQSQYSCFCCHRIVYNPFKELHHAFGRSGRLLTWVPGFRMVCRSCHDWIHRKPEYARLTGAICPKGMWNDYDKAVAFHRQTDSPL